MACVQKGVEGALRMDRGHLQRSYEGGGTRVLASFGLHLTIATPRSRGERLNRRFAKDVQHQDEARRTVFRVCTLELT
jgi:hypothetical protein